MFVPNFVANMSRDFGFRTRKPPRKFDVKSGLILKRLKYGKKYFTWLNVLSRGGVEDTRLEAKAKIKDTKKCKAKAKDSSSEDKPSRGQEQ